MSCGIHRGSAGARCVLLLRLLGVFTAQGVYGPRRAVTRLAGNFNVKLVCPAGDQRINRAHHFSKVHSRNICVAGANLAIKVPKIYAIGQRLGALPFDVFANVVLGGIQQAVAIFAFYVKAVSFFQTTPGFWCQRPGQPESRRVLCTKVRKLPATCPEPYGYPSRSGHGACRT